MIGKLGKSTSIYPGHVGKHGGEIEQHRKEDGWGPENFRSVPYGYDVYVRSTMGSEGGSRGLPKSIQKIAEIAYGAF